jgi:hypothetical protein
MTAPGDVSYDDYLTSSLTDPAEAAAYLDAAIEMEDTPALLLALRQVAKAHGMAEVARRADVGDKNPVPRPERNRKPHAGHRDQGSARNGLASECCAPAPPCMKAHAV